MLPVPRADDANSFWTWHCAETLHRILRWITVTQICQSNLPRERTRERFVREATPLGAIGHSDGENSVDSAYYQLVGVITDSQKHVIHFLMLKRAGVSNLIQYYGFTIINI